MCLLLCSYCLLPLRAIQRVCNEKKTLNSALQKNLFGFSYQKNMANFNFFFMMRRKYKFFFKDLSLLNELTQRTPLLSCCRFYLEKFDQWQICVSCLLTFEKNILALKNLKYYYFTRLMKCINKEQQQHVSLLCFTNNLQVLYPQKWYILLLYSFGRK